MFLTKEEIERNKEHFKNLVKQIKRENVKFDELFDALEKSDFYYAPASSKYHGNFEGGLVAHSLYVYYNLVDLVKMKQITAIDNDSILIAALFHDISKTNYYEKTYKNKKVYKENGSKRDAGGAFDWEVEEGYVVKDIDNRLIYGSHEQNAEYIISKYIPLTREESVAILNHMGGMSNDSVRETAPTVYGKYPLAVLLHLADMLSVYIDHV